jgi:hypothetical protein
MEITTIPSWTCCGANVRYRVETMELGCYLADLTLVAVHNVVILDAGDLSVYEEAPVFLQEELLELPHLAQFSLWTSL